MKTSRRGGVESPRKKKRAAVDGEKTGDYASPRRKENDGSDSGKSKKSKPKSKEDHGNAKSRGRKSKPDKPRTPLHLACYEGDEKKIRSLIRDLSP